MNTFKLVVNVILFRVGFLTVIASRVCKRFLLLFL